MHWNYFVFCICSLSVWNFFWENESHNQLHQIFIVKFFHFWIKLESIIIHFYAFNFWYNCFTFECESLLKLLLTFWIYSISNSIAASCCAIQYEKRFEWLSIRGINLIFYHELSSGVIRYPVFNLIWIIWWKKNKHTKHKYYLLCMSPQNSSPSTRKWDGAGGWRFIESKSCQIIPLICALRNKCRSNR